ncbi:transporter substrate-binding domain-containing protein [Phaeobacter sp. 11ANDIMAR09]|uniref:transporter substrate-binding domain-containing protein n=1 Tax=Phaeobacter sp. 11ANDIMAR09 TaxID=1225647 RepID=UPI0006D6FEBE|nr:transporter substrate-binding domain-containing protein [Phaeobacter sp. 11ANDIMAR09]KPD14284.1 glutamine ABC transporter substrate-binding protein [Phaeobacter sp. 11ANDIMAR09]
MRALRLITPFLFLLWSNVLAAQVVEVNTVTRPPFSMIEKGRETGFSIELLREISKRLDWELVIHRKDSFSDMLSGVRDAEVDLAAANISITAAREAEMDFSQPVFESGLQILVHVDDVSEPSLVNALMSWDLALAIGLAFLLLMVGGMFMWALERRAQPYFDRPLKEAWFPSFWWALNLVVNGGFEERVPRTAVGRVFGVMLVLSSLFIVSIFVAKITAVMTVEAISGSITSVNDLYGKRTGTIEASTAANFLQRRDIDYQGYNSLEELLAAFEAGDIRVVVFDAPVLNYYVQHGGSAHGRTIGSVFLREYYGFVFPQGSAMTEQVNRSLLEMQEDGSYEALYHSWFGRMN